MCGFTSKERKRNTELRQLLGLELVSFMIKKGRLRHKECKDDTDWIKHYTTMEVEGAKLRGRPRKT